MIAILAPCNPCSLKEYLKKYDNIEDFNINKTASSIVNLVKGLLNEGEKVLVVTITKEIHDSAIFYGENLTIRVIGARSQNKLLNYLPNLKTLSRLIIKQVDEEIVKISVIHAHWTYEYLLAASNYYGSLPIFCTIRDWAPYIRKSISMKPFIKGLLIKSFWIFKEKLSQKLLADKRLNVICNSAYTQDMFSKGFPGYKSIIIPNSIDKKYFKNGSSDTQPYSIVCIAGSLDDRRKNVKVLIDSICILKNKFPEIKLYLIGNYHNDYGVYKVSQDLGLINKHVIFCGTLYGDDLFSVIDKANILVCPSLEETFGNIILEGMARSKIVIGGNKSGAIPYIVNHKINGLLCDIMSCNDIASTIQFAFENSDMMQIIRCNARNYVEENYTNEIVARRHIEYYSQFR